MYQPEVLVKSPNIFETLTWRWPPDGRNM